MVKQQVQVPKEHPISNYIAEVKPFQQGGSGQIFVARNRYTNEKVAIKVIPLETPTQKSIFVNETTILSKMQSSIFTTTLIEHFVFQQRGYIVMELMEQDLYMRSESFENIEEIKDIFMQICLGVKELHDNNIAHLDIKPENVLLDEDDNVKLCDFGASFSWKNNTQYNKRVGSNYFLAPEVQLAELGYTAPIADVWSLGILLCVMITGNFPYAGHTEEQKWNNYLYANLSFDELKTVLPNDTLCHKLISGMLTKEPANRITMDEILCHPWLCSDESEWSF